MRIRLRQFILLCGDLLIFYLGLWGALLIRHNFYIDQRLWYMHIPYFTLLFIFWIVTIYVSDFYNLKNARSDQQFFIRFAGTTVVMTGLAIAFFYIIPDLPISPKLVLIYDLILTIILLLSWRAYFNHSIAIPTSNALLIGMSQAAEKLFLQIKDNPQWGYKIAGIYDKTGVDSSDNELIIFNNLDKIQNVISQTKSEILIVGDDLFSSSELIEKLFELLNKNVRIISLTKFYEQAAGKIPLENISKMWFLDNQSENTQGSFDRIKRIFDFLLALLFLFFTLPFYPLFFLIIKLDSPGPLFYKQKRVGLGGENFVVIKFRSMIKNAETNGAQWSTKGDRRITRVGKFLRRTRLDELPQLFNILDGSMSFVGPRAERPEFTEELAQKIPFFKQRLVVKPGLTGWAQVNYKYGESVDDALEKLQYDLFYIKNRNWYLDLSIILKTIRIVITGAGQ